MLYAKEVIWGDKDDAENPFRWHTVCMNLPCSQNYNLLQPWVSKIRADCTLASDFATYIDNVCTVGTGEQACHAVTRRFDSTISYMVFKMQHKSAALLVNVLELGQEP
eukprot:12323317-Ditylum_brightwellii.AAC.2